MNDDLEKVVEIHDMIDEFEDHVDRLFLSMEVSYDEDYHMSVVSDYRRIIKHIKESSISDINKAILSDKASELFVEYYTLNAYDAPSRN